MARKNKEGILHILTSYNNTILHLTDLSGETISRVSGGMVTKHNRLKANPTVSMFAAKQIGEKAKDWGIDNLYVKIKAKTGNPTAGPGAHAAIKALTKAGFNIRSIIDITKVPRGGPTKPGGRRV